MECKDCGKQSILKKDDIAVDDTIFRYSIMFIWSCPECGIIHRAMILPSEWEIER